MQVCKLGAETVNRLFLKITALMTAVFMLSHAVPQAVTAAPENEAVHVTSPLQEEEVYYNQYIKKYTEQFLNKADIDIFADEITNRQELASEVYDGISCVVLSEGEAPALICVNAEDEGLYYMVLAYSSPVDSSTSEIGIEVTLEGTYPFEEARFLCLPKRYKGETDEIKIDKNGNQIRPGQIETQEWIEQSPYDKSGFNSSVFWFYLKAGENIMTVGCNYGNLLLRKISLKSLETLPGYEEYGKTVNQSNQPKDTEILIEAEFPSHKSNSSIISKADRDDAETSPSKPGKVRLNMISFDEPGQSVTYPFEIKNSGLFEIDMRVRQRKNRGIDSIRRIYIDGKVLFSELDSVEFPYSNKWYVKTLGEKQPYSIYLGEGGHTITVECHTGYFAQTLMTVRNAVLSLNDILRNIIMVTGTEPDPFRDYSFKTEIPQLSSMLTDTRNALKTELERLSAIKDFSGSELVTVEDMIRQLDSFISDPRSIPSKLESFRSNISALSVWINNIKAQYLEIDYIAVRTPDVEKRRNRASLFKQIKHNVTEFLLSFASDYAVDESEENLSVWAFTGRDQANVINRIIGENYGTGHDGNISLSNVDAGSTLLQAVLAGKGPDVALFVTEDIPVNLAARGALAPVDDFISPDKMRERFYESSLIPCMYDGKCYAVPNSQSFNMMFYRKDIFAELEISPPKTWDEFYDALPAIQRSNMQVGVGGDSQLLFESLVLQNGGRYFSDDLSKTNFDSAEVLDSFKTWTGFYSDYQLPLSYDFFNRFRTGEMPLAIAPYVQYNLLNIAAPEIRGLWEMTGIPGMKMSDGSVNRAETSTVTASVVIESSKAKEAAFEFLEWWSSNEIQTAYANELEVVMGPSARFDPANKNILEQMRWSRDEAKTINQQWDSVSHVEVLPTTYYITRNLTNAYRDVIYNYKNEREVLNKYNRIINAEISRKNTELEKYR